MRLRTLRWPLVVSAIVLALLLGGFMAYKTAIQTFKTKIEQALGPRGEVKEIRVDLTGVEIIDLHIKASPEASANGLVWPADDELRATRILVFPSFFDLLTGKIVIETLRVENAYIAMLRTRDGKVRVLPSLLNRGSAANKGQAADASGNAAPPEIRINRIELVNGAVEFFDATVRTPPHKLRLEQINAAVGRLRLPELNGVSTLDVAGTLKGINQDGKISISGTVEFATKESGLTTRLRNVDLVTLQPYLLKATEAGVKTGTLDLDLNSSVKKGILHAPGTLTLKNLELASASGTLMGMPRNAVIGAMKSRDGKITLKFVLDGNINDPHFSLNENLALRLGSSLAGSLGVSIEGLAKGVGSLGGSAARGLGDSLGKLFKK